MVPGYGNIYEPAAPMPLTITLQQTRSTYGRYAAKSGSTTTQPGFSYAPNANVQFGGYFGNQDINFKPVAQASPERNQRFAYFLDLYKDIGNNTGYLGIVTKGNYILRSAYNEDAADGHLMPYVGVSYKTYDQLNTAEMGYAHENYSDAIATRVNQYNFTFSTLKVENWMFSVTPYFINVSYGAQNPNHRVSQNFFAVAPAATYFIGTKHSISVDVLLGQRKNAYDLAINKVYDIRDKEVGGGGVTYMYNFTPHVSAFGNFSGERFRKDQTDQFYWAHYITAGLITSL